MPHDDPYEAWKQARASADVSEGFADRVMASLEARRERTRAAAVRELLMAAVASRLGRVAIWSLAGAACALRIHSVIALFLVP